MPSMGSSLLILELLLLLLLTMLAKDGAISFAFAGCTGDAARTANVVAVAFAETAAAARAGNGVDIDIGVGNELRDPRDI